MPAPGVRRRAPGPRATYRRRLDAATGFDRAATHSSGTR